MPLILGMLESFFLLYGIVIVSGSWVMLKGIADAPLGYEDEDGFHFAPVKVAVNRLEFSEED